MDDLPSLVGPTGRRSTTAAMFAVVVERLGADVTHWRALDFDAARLPFVVADHVWPPSNRASWCQFAPVRWNASTHGRQAKRCSSRRAFNVESPRTRFQAVTI
jgi:hypothetical protein